MSMGRSSSVTSFSLLEIKAESRLVLQAFLNRVLSVPPVERPGRVGGAYKDKNKYSASIKPEPKVKDGWDSQAEEQSSGDEKKTGFKGFLKQLPRRSTVRPFTKDGKGTLEKDSKPKAPNIRALSEEDVLSPSSTSEDDDGGGEKKQSKRLNRKKIKKSLSKIFKIKLEKDKAKEKEREKEGEENKKDKKAPGAPPQRPSTLVFDKTAELIPIIVSPNHPPAFYYEVAEKLERIAQKSASLKRSSCKGRVSPPPAAGAAAAQAPSVVDDKELMVQQLVEVLSAEADSINNKIQTDPFLRASLSRLSYASYARLLDLVSSTQESDLTFLQPMSSPMSSPTSSPTLRRMAVTMELSRRIVTATGVHRMQGYAECYMETFAPWLKSQGGWENVVEMEDSVEYD
ncbi:uncharacterized protein bcl2l12 [Syngnathus typhle]|uniref:uncharacterized protein bcl2l12 n=1 Tax=Syngnathus typhle TaxID=161592 RepID=UPI002A6AD37C|nr:uncharacterized protein bcl2l12 [Syngnathus typhle]